MLSLTSKNLIKYSIFNNNNKYFISRLITTTIIGNSSNNYNNNHNNNNNNSIGLLGIKELKTASGWNDLFEKKHEKIIGIRDYILPNKINEKSTLEQLKNTLYYIDEISRQLCDLMDPAQFVMNILPYSQHKIESQLAFLRMSEIVNQLNTNSELYQLLVSIKNHKLFKDLPNDHKLFLNEMIKESEANGINLKPKEKLEIMNLKDEIFAEGSLFIESSLNSYKNPPNSIIEIPYNQLVEHLPKKYLNQIPKPINGVVSITPTDYIVSGILKYIPDPNIRYSIHRLQTISNCYDPVLKHLTKLISKRLKLAKSLGCDTYADYELQNKLLKSPLKVKEYLIQLSNEYKSKSDKELSKLIEIKKRMEPFNPDNDKIFTWDLPFYKNQMSREFYKSHSLDKEELSQYFTLENVLNGLNVICNRLFDSQLKLVQMDSGESWDPTILKLHLTSNPNKQNQSQLLGTLYLDPWERNDKATGCVNHPLSLGYKKHNILFTEGEGNTDEQQEGSESYNTPKCSITCSFTQNNFKDPLKSKLRHSDVEILFHEFGHACHTLLSRSNFQHLCGTRGPTDFIEIPSTLMENFSWNPELLQEFAIIHNNQDGSDKPISNEMITNLRKTRNLFEGIETQEQISLALLDLKLHTTKTDNLNNSNISPAQLLSKIHLEQIGIHGACSNFFLTSFNHLFYYGASYYSYLLAKDYSKRIWVNHFDSGKQLNREKGQFYLQNFLKPGASIDPSLILNKFIK